MKVMYKLFRVVHEVQGKGVYTKFCLHVFKQNHKNLI